MLPEYEFKKKSIPYTIEHWLTSISKQIDYWTSNPHFPTLIVNTDRLSDPKVLSTLKDLLGSPESKMKFQPRQTKEPLESLAPHQKKIEKINLKLKKLPEMELRCTYNTLSKLPRGG